MNVECVTAIVNKREVRWSAALAALVVMCIGGLLLLDLAAQENQDLQFRRNALRLNPDNRSSNGPMTRQRKEIAQIRCGLTDASFKTFDESARKFGVVINNSVANEAESRKSSESQKRTFQVGARGAYLSLRRMVVAVLAEVPCGAINSLDFHRDRSTDAVLSATVQFFYYSGDELTNAN